VSQPGFSLGMTGPAAGVVGQPMILHVAGSTPPPAEYGFPSWLEVDAIPTRVLQVCPDGYADAWQIARAAGGESLAFAQLLNVDATGAFANTVAFTPKASGGWLICGYAENGLTGTLTGAALTVDVRPAPAGGAPGGTPPAPAPPAGTAPAPATAGAKPVNAKAPRVRRSGSRLVCSPGRWSNATGGYSYGWAVNGKRKKGADDRKLRITRALRGRKLTCSVTASNAAGAATAVSRPLRVS
jgi:hypothetical protein